MKDSSFFCGEVSPLASCCLTRSINALVEFSGFLLDSDASGAMTMVASKSTGFSASISSGSSVSPVSSMSTGGFAGITAGALGAADGIGADPSGATGGFAGRSVDGIGADPSCAVGGFALAPVSTGLSIDGIGADPVGAVGVLVGDSASKEPPIAGIGAEQKLSNNFEISLRFRVKDLIQHRVHYAGRGCLMPPIILCRGQILLLDVVCQILLRRQGGLLLVAWLESARLAQACSILRLGWKGLPLTQRLGTVYQVGHRPLHSGALFYLLHQFGQHS